jgi:hypothetical protein
VVESESITSDGPDAVAVIAPSTVEPVGTTHLIELFTDTLLRIAYTNYKASSHLDAGWERNVRSFPTADVVSQFLYHFGVASVCSEEAVSLIIWCFSLNSLSSGPYNVDESVTQSVLVNWFDLLTWMLRPTCSSFNSAGSGLTEQDDSIYPLLCHKLLSRAVKLLQDDHNCKLVQPLLILWPLPAAIDYGTRLSSDQLNAKLSYITIPGTNEEIRGEFRYSPPIGELLDAGTHSLRVCFIPMDSTRFPLIEQSVSLIVNKIKPVLRWMPHLGEIEMGQELSDAQLCATCYHPLVLELQQLLAGSFFYSKSVGYIFSKVGIFDISVSFFPESWNFCQVSEIRKIKVVPRSSNEQAPKIEPTVIWDESGNPPLKVGEELSEIHLHATILEEGILGNFFYSKPYGYVFSKPGEYDITTTFVPQEPFDWRYKQASKTIKIRVIHKDPLRTMILWDNPEPIIYGTVLSDVQLCAMCVDMGSPEEIQGSYKYSHDVGQQLEPGEHMLEVSFTPSDVTAHQSAYAYVTIEVQRIIPALDWQPIEHSIHINDPLPESIFNAVCTSDIEGSIRYSRPAGHAYSKPGRYELTAHFMPQDPIYYAPQTCANHVNIIKPITFGKIVWESPEEIEHGTPLSEAQLNARFELEEPLDREKEGMVVVGSFIYDPPEFSILDAGIQVLNCRFIPPLECDLDLRFDPKYSVSITVGKIKPVMKWKTELGQIEVGEELTSEQLCAICHNPLSLEDVVDGSFFYSRSFGYCFSRPGVYDIVATFLPSEYYGRNFRQVAMTATIEVLPALADVDIVWPFPASIDYPSPLSDVELCAQAIDRSTSNPVHGEFEYVPGLHTVLDAGRHTLVVTFTPSSRPGHTLRKTVDITLNKGMPMIVWKEDSPQQTIFVGEELSDNQLNAACHPDNIDGLFTYSVPLGFKFSGPGIYDIVATFTPATPNWFQAVKMATITVIPKINEIHSVLKLCEPPDIDYLVPLTEDLLQPSCIDTETSAVVPGTYRYSPPTGTVLEAGDHVWTVSFAPDDAGRYSVLEKSTKITVRKIVPKIRWDIPEDSVFVGIELTGDVLNAKLEDNSIAGTFFYSRTAGFAFPRPEMCEIFVTFVPAETFSRNYSQATKSVAFYVRMPDPTSIEIEWRNPDSIPFGTPLSHIQLCARCVNAVTDDAVENEAVDYSRRQPAPAHRERVDIASTFQYFPHLGHVLEAGIHELSVVVTFQNPLRYGTSASKSVYITVDKLKPTIVWDDPVPIVSGSVLTETQLNAQCMDGITGTFLYTPSMGTTVDEGGYHILSVIFFPDVEYDRNYRQTSATVHLLIIESETPNISINAEVQWDRPSPICYGTRLTKQQLNARCTDREFGTEVEGVYEYTPNFGDILGEGTHTLHVLFFPTNKRRFGEVFKSEIILQVFSPSSVQAHANLAASPATTAGASSKYSSGLRDLVRHAADGDQHVVIQPHQTLFSSRRICFHRLIIDGRVLKKAKFGDVIVKLKLNADEFSPVEMYKFEKVDGVANFHFESKAIDLSAADFLTQQIMVSIRGRTTLKGSRVEFTAAATVPLSQIIDVQDGPFHITLFAYPKLWLADLHTLIADEDINNKCKLRLSIVAHAFEPKFGAAMTATGPIFGSSGLPSTNHVKPGGTTEKSTIPKRRPSSAGAAGRPRSAGGGGTGGRASYADPFSTANLDPTGDQLNYMSTGYLPATPARKLFHSPAGSTLPSKLASNNGNNSVKGRYGPYHELIEPASPPAPTPFMYKPRSRPNSAPQGGRRPVNRPLVPVVVTETAALAKLEAESALRDYNVVRWPECTQGKSDLKFAVERILPGWRPSSPERKFMEDSTVTDDYNQGSQQRHAAVDGTHFLQQRPQVPHHNQRMRSPNITTNPGDEAGVDNDDEYSYI